MQFPENLLYSKDHEWILQEENLVTLGITDYAQDELGDVVYVDLPSPGDEIGSGASIASLESVKAVSDVYSPVSGTLEKVNGDLQDHPEKINSDPYGAGWIARLRVSAEEKIEGLMSAAEYEAYVRAESEG